MKIRDIENKINRLLEAGEPADPSRRKFLKKTAGAAAMASVPKNVITLAKAAGLPVPTAIEIVKASKITPSNLDIFLEIAKATDLLTASKFVRAWYNYGTMDDVHPPKDLVAIYDLGKDDPKFEDYDWVETIQELQFELGHDGIERRLGRPLAVQVIADILKKHGKEPEEFADEIENLDRKLKHDLMPREYTGSNWGEAESIIKKKIKNKGLGITAYDNDEPGDVYLVRGFDRQGSTSIELKATSEEEAKKKFSSRTNNRTFDRVEVELYPDSKSPNVSDGSEKTTAADVTKDVATDVAKDVAANAAKSAAATGMKSQFAAGALASFKELVNRVLDKIGVDPKTGEPRVKDMGRIEPTSSLPALPAPKKSDVDFMKDLRNIIDQPFRDIDKAKDSVIGKIGDVERVLKSPEQTLNNLEKIMQNIVDRPLTDQEKEIVRQELRKDQK